MSSLRIVNIESARKVSGAAAATAARPDDVAAVMHLSTGEGSVPRGSRGIHHILTFVALVLIAAGLFGPTLSTSAADASAPLANEAEPYQDERDRFMEARDALARGDRARFIELEEGLGDYPLHRYLVYERLRERWRREAPVAADMATLEAFSEASGDRTLSVRLARTLQGRFAESGDWPAFEALASGALGQDMPCRELQAQEALAPPKQFDEQTRALWIAPSTDDRRCVAALDALESRTTPPISAIWERIHAAMEADDPAHAEPLLGYLGTRDRRPVEAWIKALDDPAAYLKSGALARDDTFNRRVLADLVLAWSKDDVIAATEYWLAVNGEYAFSVDGRHDTERALFMRTAYRRLPEAQGWLAAFDARDDDLEAKEWRVRTALLAGDWNAVLETMGRLPAEEQAEDHWRYWEARAHENLGRMKLAKPIYAELASLQSWHGFLSAERIGQPLSIEDEPVELSSDARVALEADPELIRAREYYRVDLAHEGRREWNSWLGRQDAATQAASAVLAARWGLDDRAIFSAGRAERRRALALRFPVLYADEVSKEAAEHRIEPAIVHGIMRRESAYIADIRSPAGAIGLMQLMPNTAKEVARLKGDKNWRGNLTDPATNIAFGTFYFRHVLDRYDGHKVLAAASYNAGPHRVKSWLPEDAPMEADRWIDTIPFTETRRYVRAVFAYAAIYEQRLSGGVFQLGRYLLPVPAAESKPAG